MPQNSLQLLLPFITAGAGALATILTYHFVGKRRLILAHRQELIREQSARFHEYVMAYYMPVVSSIANFLPRLRRIIEEGQTTLEGEDAYELSFFFFTLYWTTEQVSSKELKTLFLTDSTAETVLSTLEIKIIGQLTNLFSRNDLSLIAQNIKPDTPFIDFKSRLATPQLKKIFEQKYRPWIETKIKNTPFVNLLTCYCNLFSFEINEGYKTSWYKENPVKLTNKDLEITRGVLTELRKGRAINFRQEREFLKRITKK